MHHDPQWLSKQAAINLERLLPLLAGLVDDIDLKNELVARLKRHFPAIFELTFFLYGHHYDYYYHLETILRTAVEGYVARSEDLKTLDRHREQNPLWYQSHEMFGAVCYVDLFAGNLKGLREKLPYFEELGVTYLHLMPLFEVPARNNDGGYAISSFRNVNPALGTMNELEQLTTDFRQHGISLVLDFVFNHTSDEHPWARAALAGDENYQNYYRIFPDRTLPDAYEPFLREIFPEQAPGSFTYVAELNQWVWTTFYNFQWDLNYANPQLFRAMLEEMIFLANRGIEVLRLDAVPFIWKELGTACENLPQVNMIISAYNALVKIACPALLFKSEAIVHPRDVRSYIGENKCPLSYNPIMMVSLWEALATREVYFFTHTMQKQFSLESQSSWLNYVRSHDDIGWGFADEDAAEVGINGHDHRYFLNQYFTGRFPGSFARGEPFNFNPRTGDMRISGTCASLVGIEAALREADEWALELAIRRLHLIYGICLSAGGIPLLYLGDEVGTLNDPSYIDEEQKRNDSRWLHRPRADDQLYTNRYYADSVAGRVFQPLKRMIWTRKSHHCFRNGETQFIHSNNQHVLAFTRNLEMLVLANFSEHSQTIAGTQFDHYLVEGFDLIGEKPVGHEKDLRLAPYQLLWIIGNSFNSIS